MQVYSTCFGRISRPSSGVQKNVTAASGIGHSNGATTMFRAYIAPIIRSTKNVTAASGIGHSNGATTYTRGYGYIFLLLIMGAIDARNMQSKLAVNKYLHTVASCWILLILNHDAWNHEYKTLDVVFSISSTELEHAIY